MTFLNFEMSFNYCNFIKVLDRDLHFKTYCMKFFFYILFFSPFFVFAQVKQGSITYEMLLDKSMWKTNGEYQYEIRELDKEVAQVSFTLLYNKEGMIFSDNRTEAEIKKTIFGINPGIRYYYKKASSDTLYSIEKTANGKNVTSKLRYDTDWQLTKESKKINGFVCYKATRIPSPNSNEEVDKSFPIIAWYTPEIPLPYGPFTYGGLPGLILELQREGITVFKAKTMRWDDNNEIKIEFPNSF